MTPTDELDVPSTENVEWEAQQAIAGSQPIMEDPEDLWTKLPRGLHVGERWDQQAVVRELTGEDEENLARYRRDPFLLLDAVLAYGVESIGSTHLADKSFEQSTSILRDLLIGEREQLFLAVAKATFGDNKSLSYTCQTCGEVSLIDLSLTDNITIPPMNDPERETYSFSTKTGTKIEYRLLTGNDQITLNGRSKSLSDAETNTLLMSEIIVSANGKPLVDPQVFARSMGMRDRAMFLEALVKSQPTPDMNMTTECSSCSASVTLPLTWELVFRS